MCDLKSKRDIVWLKEKCFDFCCICSK